MTINYHRDLTHCTALLINLTLWEHLQFFWAKTRGVCALCKSDIFDTKPVISWNEAVESQSCCTLSIETRVRQINWWQIWWPCVTSNVHRQAYVSCTSVRVHNSRTDSCRSFKLSVGVDHVTHHVWPLLKVTRSKIKVTRLLSYIVYQQQECSN